jgi:Transglutaminase-like superfamily
LNVRSLIEARLCHRARARSQTVILKINYPLAKKIFAAIIFLALMKEYLQVSKVINWNHPTILQLAKQIAAEQPTSTAVAKACFEWVRDEIRHSSDYKMNPVTCRASDVLKYRTGYCFAKSHLLAALLRANGIPTGFCYQRLSVRDDGEPYSLHGYNAVYLPEVGWYRIDARGNHQDIDAQFVPPQEKLAYAIRLVGEVNFQNIFAEPLPIVVEALQSYSQWDEMLCNLPDISLESLEQYGLVELPSS